MKLSKMFLLSALAIFLVLPVLSWAIEENVTVTWDSPENTDIIIGYEIRVNKLPASIVSVPGKDTCEWSGVVTLKAGENIFDMRSKATDGGVSVWSEPAYYAPGICVPLNMQVVLDTSLIIDNGADGTSFVGSWQPSEGLNFYNTGSLFAKGHGSSYTFEVAINGTPKVSLWWTTMESRCPETIVEVYDGELLVGTVLVDQKVNGGQWNLLGTYTFTGLAKVVINSQGSCSVCADAVRFQ